MAANEGAGEGNAVYLYANADASAGDVNVDDDGEPDHPAEVAGNGDDSDGDLDEVNPITVANVRLNSNTGNYEYTVGFVAEGSYTIAFTCQSLTDEPGTDEATLFVQPTNVSVNASLTTTQNFSAQPVAASQ